MKQFALIVISLLGFQGITMAAVPSAERDALVTLYNSTNGTSWSTKTNWLIGDPCVNAWYGVGCDVDSKITRVTLNNNNIVGAIPTELGALINLEWLWLDNNKLSGSIPGALGNLTNLEQLDLSGNELSGSIPTELGSLSSLNWLQLNSNQLSGAIPSEIGDLASLQYLIANHNLLDGTMPPELGNLGNLEWLWLDDNKLSGPIPGTLGDLVKLEQMDLSGNELSDSIPSELGSLSSLNWLQLNGNQLSGAIPSEIGGLASLHYLIANHNQLDGTIPPELGNLTNLKWIWLDDNKLSGSIPFEVGNLANLEQLDLDGNQLSGSIPATLESLVNLNDGFGLSLGWNALYTLDAGLDDFLNGKSGGDWSSTQTTAPENISVTKAGVNAISLEWGAIEYTSSAGRYTVLYSTSAGGSYVEGGSTANKSVTTLSVTGLEPETTYYFVMQSITDSHTFNQNNVASEFSHQKIVDTVSVGSVFRDGFEER